MVNLENMPSLARMSFILKVRSWLFLRPQQSHHLGFKGLLAKIMRKSLEIILTALMNLSVTLMAGGILKFALDIKSAISSAIISLTGFYIFLAVSILANLFDKKE